ncbi:uncharacterized protein [Asterias amurensis]|uniref:uncharacterized protein n=1 Tax=Asterias amurensis TaxID=7602 RepID=UPI003AB7D5EE
MDSLQMSNVYFVAIVFVGVLSLSVASTLSPTHSKNLQETPTATEESGNELDAFMKNLLKDLNLATDKPEYDYGKIPEMPEWWTKSPLWNTEASYPGHFDDQFPKVDLSKEKFTIKPIYFDNQDFNNDNIWEGDNKMSSYSWITLTIVLVVFFKVTVIGIMIARRMRRTQHRVVIRSSRSSAMTLPSEFTSDQAHLVTPANIIYVDTEGALPPQIPQIYTPPPYTESLLPNDSTTTYNNHEQPPPYSG